MDRIFLLQHENPDTEDVKFIGIYRSRSAAEKAVERLCVRPGFRDYPNGFSIDDYPLDTDHWTEGFGIA